MYKRLKPDKVLKLNKIIRIFINLNTNLPSVEKGRHHIPPGSASLDKKEATMLRGRSLLV